METKPLYRLMEKLLEERNITRYRFFKEIGLGGCSFNTKMNVDPRLSSLQTYADYFNMPLTEFIRQLTEEEKKG